MVDIGNDKQPDQPEPIQAIMDELSMHISRINHFNAAPIKDGAIACLARLKQELSKNKVEENRDHGCGKHTTEDEMRFIDRIGIFTVIGKLNTRLELLRMYEDAMQNKADWGEVNQYQIKVYVKEAISVEEDACAFRVS